MTVPYVHGCSSPFSAVSLCGVAGIAETMSIRQFSDPIFYHLTSFHVPSDSVPPSQTLSSFTDILPIVMPAGSGHGLVVRDFGVGTLGSWVRFPHLAWFTLEA